MKINKKHLLVLMIVACQPVNKIQHQTIYYKDLIGARWKQCFFYSTRTGFEFNIEFMDSSHLEMANPELNYISKADYFIENNNGQTIIHINGVNQKENKFRLTFLAKIQNSDTLKFQFYRDDAKNIWENEETRFNTGVFIRRK